MWVDASNMLLTSARKTMAKYTNVNIHKPTHLQTYSSTNPTTLVWHVFIDVPTKKSNTWCEWKIIHIAIVCRFVFFHTINNGMLHFTTHFTPQTSSIEGHMLLVKLWSGSQTVHYTGLAIWWFIFGCTLNNAWWMHCQLLLYNHLCNTATS